MENHVKILYIRTYVPAILTMVPKKVRSKSILICFIQYTIFAKNVGSEISKIIGSSPKFEIEHIKKFKKNQTDLRI